MSLKEILDAAGLAEEVVARLEQFVRLLLDWNKKMNLTAITDEREIAFYHILDSLAVADYIKSSKIASLADIGSGGGLPGIPLKILFPNLSVTLIEVNQKKASFLHYVTQELGLQDTHVCTDDWRTFLRTSTHPIDLFCARASLAMPELLRVFKPSSTYRQATLVYWASRHWQADEHAAPYVQRVQDYRVGDKQRKLIFFATN